MGIFNTSGERVRTSIAGLFLTFATACTFHEDGDPNKRKIGAAERAGEYAVETGADITHGAARAGQKVVDRASDAINDPKTQEGFQKITEKAATAAGQTAYSLGKSVWKAGQKIGKKIAEDIEKSRPEEPDPGP